MSERVSISFKELFIFCRNILALLILFYGGKMKKFIKEMCNTEYDKAYDEYKNMPKEKRAFEYAYLEANLKIIPVFSILFSLLIFMFNNLEIFNPIIGICVAGVFLLKVVYAIACTSLRLDALKEIEKEYL
jgi:hypothetical protein